MEPKEQFEEIAQQFYERIQQNRETAVLNAVADGVCEFHTACFFEVIEIGEYGKLNHKIKVFSGDSLWEKE